MGNLQNQFTYEFKQAFNKRFDTEAVWTGGQILDNVAGLPSTESLRRKGKLVRGERFELGDLKTHVSGFTVIVEYDSEGVSLSNLLKYWPYIKGELSTPPTYPIILCTFSDWRSYGSHRSLWQWLLMKMQSDAEVTSHLQAQQFDHGGVDLTTRDASIQKALDWLNDLGVGTSKMSPLASVNAN